MLYKQIGVKGMSKDIELLKERIIALVDEIDLPYVIPLLNDLENAIHEHSFESGYGIGMMLVGKVVSNKQMREVAINE